MGAQAALALGQESSIGWQARPPIKALEAMPTKLHVAGLDKDQAIDKGELEDLFKEYGRVTDIWVARQPPGFGFVTFEEERDAEDAIKALDGTKFRSETLKVQVSNQNG